MKLPANLTPPSPSMHVYIMKRKDETSGRMSVQGTMWGKSPADASAAAALRFGGTWDASKWEDCAESTQRSAKTAGELT